MEKLKEKRDDDVTFNRLVLDNHQKVYNLVRKFVSTHEEADDLTQETFLKVYKNLPKFRFQSQPSTWIYRIAVNTAINHLRREKIHRFINLENAHGVYEDTSTVPSDESKNILRRAVSQLAPRQQIVVMLRSYQELSFREIAEIMECTENAAKVNFSHALKNLRDIMRKIGVSYETL